MRSTEDADARTVGGLEVDHPLEREDDRVAEGQTSAFSGCSCRQCGGPISGRRRNGFCSDCCRLRHRRAARRNRIDALLTTLQVTVTLLRRELIPDENVGERP